jgi:AcrR family transcriptional regulator
MARPPTHHESRKAAIVEAALDCFARHGYDGATNKLIAEAAGMRSAALIYHYFPSKEDLFQACLERVSAFDTMRDILEARQDDPPDIFLRQVGRTYLGLMREDERLAKLALMVFSSFQSHPEVPPLALRRVIPALFLPLVAYFQRQAELGALRPLPPLTTVMQFFSPLVFRAVSMRLASTIWPVPVDSDEAYIDNLVQIFLDGARRRDGAMPPDSH